jgi:ACS family tartrate transporter-like MFS transporter
MSSPVPTAAPSPLDRARAKAYRRLLPLLFLCYVVAYVDRNNLSIAIETMKQDMPAFNNDVLGTGAGIFFIGYFLLEIPGTILVEKWSARKWISRIMISWGIVAALTALVKTLMMAEALTSLVTIAVVAGRAISLLGS